MDIIDNQYTFVEFEKYCKNCKHNSVDDIKGEEPCNECLSNPVNLNSKKPVKYEEKED